MTEQRGGVLEGIPEQAGSRSSRLKRRQCRSASPSSPPTHEDIHVPDAEPRRCPQVTARPSLAYRNSARNGAETRNGQEQLAAGLLHRHARAVLEQAGQHLPSSASSTPVDIRRNARTRRTAAWSRPAPCWSVARAICQKQRKGRERRAESTSSGQPLGKSVYLEAVHSSLKPRSQHPYRMFSRRASA